MKKLIIMAACLLLLTIVTSCLVSPELVTFSFDSNGGSAVPEQRVRIKAFVDEPDNPVKDGYSFIGWFIDERLTTIFDFSTMTAEVDITLFAKWSADSDTSYIIEHYLQDVSGNGYTKYETENVTGITDTTATAVEKEYIGFSENSNHVSRIVNGTIASDGSLVLRLYYDRNLYTVSFDCRDVGSADDVYEVRYGATISAPTPPSGDGYSFLGWYKDYDLTNSWSFSSDTVTRNTILYAKWERIIDFNESRKLTSLDADELDAFGWSVAIGGDYAIVGAYGDADNGVDSGSAYIFLKNSIGIWDVGRKITASDGTAGDQFGYSVGISDDNAIVGAYKDNENGDQSGSAYIFHRDSVSGDWDEGTKITAFDGSMGDYFGISVAISGDYAIVGAYKESHNGSAYIFHRDSVSGDWDEGIKIQASDGTVESWFGRTVSISGDYAIVGAYKKDGTNGVDAGRAYIFHRDSGSGEWNEVAKLTASDGSEYDFFGSSVSISGDYAIVGAYGDNEDASDTGSAYIFHRDSVSGEWGGEAKITASDGLRHDFFGTSVGISGNYAIVGAYHTSDNGLSSGSAYMFHRDDATGNWSEIDKILARDGDINDEFGRAVAISDNCAIAGAAGKDDDGAGSGSAYIID